MANSTPKTSALASWRPNFQPWFANQGGVDMHPLLRPRDLLVPVHVEHWSHYRVAIALASPAPRDLDARTLRRELDFVYGDSIVSGQVLMRRDWDY
jgi:hypothetical protein